jgi:hypothetical protein
LIVAIVSVGFTARTIVFPVAGLRKICISLKGLLGDSEVLVVVVVVVAVMVRTIIVLLVDVNVDVDVDVVGDDVIAEVAVVVFSACLHTALPFWLIAHTCPRSAQLTTTAPEHSVG